MRPLFLNINGERKRVYAQKIKGQLWVHIDGKTFTYEPEKTGRRKGSVGPSGSSHPGIIVAPMPGRVTKIRVEAGQKVEVNDVVVVMEAMKMEYTLKALHSGVVESVKCKIGDQALLGQVLVKFKFEGQNDLVKS